jgi:hypothetical protein
MPIFYRAGSELLSSSAGAPWLVLGAGVGTFAAGATRAWRSLRKLFDKGS